MNKMMLAWGCLSFTTSVFAFASPEVFAKVEADMAKMPPLAETMTTGLTYDGDQARLQRLFKKLEQGKHVTVAMIGGSITIGAITDPWDPRLTYSAVAVSEITNQFKRASATWVNAGKGATGTAIGSFRCKRQVLDKKPDLVVVEFSVNESNSEESSTSCEGLLRQLVGAEGAPAIIQLGMLTEDGRSAQDAHLKVAKHYGVPFLSYRDLIWPHLQAKEVAWKDISPDNIHPNNLGHRYVGKMIGYYLKAKYEQWKKSGRKLSKIAPMPKPMYGIFYDHGDYQLMTELKPLENRGFREVKDRAWDTALIADKPGDRLVFEVEGDSLALLYRKGLTPRAFGKIKITLDGKVVEEAFDCYGTYKGALTTYHFICKGQPGKHRVEIEVLNDKNEKSDGYGCLLSGVLIGK